MLGEELKIMKDKTGISSDRGKMRRGTMDINKFIGLPPGERKLALCLEMVKAWEVNMRYVPDEHKLACELFLQVREKNSVAILDSLVNMKDSGLEKVPKDPTFLPSNFDPKASQQSSIKNKPFSSQKFLITFALNGFPSVCAIITALVFFVRAFFKFVTSIFAVFRSTSRYTGTHLFKIIGATVVGKPVATVITSSPS